MLYNIFYYFYFVYHIKIDVFIFSENKYISAKEMMTTTEQQTVEYLHVKFNSIQQLLAYIKEIQLFDNYQTVDNDAEHEKKYPYQIPLEKWISESGWLITQDFCLVFPDGAIFVDRYFDSDYRDYDMPTRYVYIYRCNP